MPPRPRPESSKTPRVSRPAKGRPQTRRPAASDRPGRRGDQVPESRGGRVLPAPDVDAETEELTDTLRLQKFLAMAGVDSRRNCEEYIRTGRVTVNAEVVTDPARAVDPKTQDIRLDSERLRMPRLRYFLVNKPKGVLCTNHDPQGRPRAIDLIPPSEQRLFTVGRLDENTEGMLLLTNDGDLAQRLAHPRFEVIRRYRCHVAGIPQPETLRQLREGMYFAEGFFKFRSVHIFRRKGQSVILEMDLQEGKNREIRRLLARVGHKVLALERIAFGPLQLGSLAPGRHRELQPFEIHELRHFAEHGEKPATRGAKASDSFGYRTGQTRGKRRGVVTRNERPADRERTPPRNLDAESTLPVRTELPPIRRNEQKPQRDHETAPRQGRALDRERTSPRPAETDQPSRNRGDRGGDRKPERRTVRRPEETRDAAPRQGRAFDRERAPQSERGPQRERAPQREQVAEGERGDFAARPSLRRPAASRLTEPRQTEQGASENRMSARKPMGQKPVGQKPARKKTGVKKTGAKKPFRSDVPKTAAPINKGRDRRRNK
jgi:23S rRNA pseudouridine2605 synthase